MIILVDSNVLLTKRGQSFINKLHPSVQLVFLLTCELSDSQQEMMYFKGAVISSTDTTPLELLDRTLKSLTQPPTALVSANPEMLYLAELHHIPFVRKV